MKYKRLFIGVLFVILIISICINGKIASSRKNWQINHHDSVIIERLFEDSLELQVNTYINNQLKSYFVLNPYDVNRRIAPSGFGDQTDSTRIKSILSYYVNKKLFTKDSMCIYIWKPVERGYSYKYQMLKNDKMIWEKKSENEPVFKFSFPFSMHDDTTSYVFTMRYWVYKGKKVFGPYNKDLWEEKNRELRFDYEW
jgi:hypothetical protein